MSKCRGCGAEISWVRMTSGRLIPVDPGRVFIVDGSGDHIIVTEGGTIANGIECPGGQVPAGKRRGWESHFAACPAAATFRRRKG